MDVAAPCPAPIWAAGIAEAFAWARDEGGGVFNLPLHPWVAGQAHRIRYLPEALSAVLAKSATWRATTNEVAHVARTQLDSVTGG